MPVKPDSIKSSRNNNRDDIFPGGVDLRAVGEIKSMNLSKCPHCGARLGNFLYADACPHCHEELKHNTRPLLSSQKQDQKAQVWPVPMFARLLRFVES